MSGARMHILDSRIDLRKILYNRERLIKENPPLLRPIELRWERARRQDSFFRLMKMDASTPFRLNSTPKYLNIFSFGIPIRPIRSGVVSFETTC